MPENPMQINETIVLSKIHTIRDQNVMLDSDLAELYGVETKRLNEQVKRNSDRFPKDFMLQLTAEEFKDLKSQNATSSWGGRRKLPYAFTEHGVLMLSSVLNSQTAIQVNIQIMRVYNKAKRLLLSQKDMLLKIEQLEYKADKQDEDIEVIFRTLKKLLNNPKSEERQPIGYKTKSD